MSIAVIVTVMIMIEIMIMIMISSTVPRWRSFSILTNYLST